MLHRVLPCLVGIGIQALVDDRIWFLNLSVSSRRVLHLQCLENVPTEGELTVPEELLRESERQLGASIDIALLEFIVVARDVGIETYVLRQVVEVLCLQYVKPLRLSLQVLEGFPRLILRCILVAHVELPVFFVFVYGCLARLVSLAIRIAECKV